MATITPRAHRFIHIVTLASFADLSTYKYSMVTKVSNNVIADGALTTGLTNANVNVRSLTVTRTAVTGTPVTNDGNVFSGTYTPVLTAVTNITATPVSGGCQYMRVGDVVTVSGRIDFAVTVINTNSQLGVSLPIASNFTNSRQCGGTASNGFTPYGDYGVAIIADSVNNRAEFRLTPPVTSEEAYWFTFTYIIV